MGLAILLLQYVDLKSIHNYNGCFQLLKKAKKGGFCVQLDLGTIND